MQRHVHSRRHHLFLADILQQSQAPDQAGRLNKVSSFISEGSHGSKEASAGAIATKQAT